MRDDFAAFAMHVILDDLFQPDAHMDRGRDHESEHGNRHDGRAEIRLHRLDSSRRYG